MIGVIPLKKISIIVPCFNEQEMISTFYEETEKVLESMTDVYAEYWFIDDGSTDNSFIEIKKLSETGGNVHFILFSRNFGKEAAIYAGLKSATGDFVVIMDVDLQDPPQLLSEMYNILMGDEDIDCVGTRRFNRVGEPPIRSFFSNSFYIVINKISNIKIVNGARDYLMMNRMMTNAVLEMTEYNRFSKGIFSWVGFNTKYIEYSNVERKSGSTSWSFKSLLQYSIDGITDFSEVPLSIASWVGTMSSILSIIGIIFVLVRALIVPESSVYGWASMVCIFMFFGGIQLLSLGILGKYIGKIFLQSKNRPIYIVKDKK